MFIGVSVRLPSHRILTRVNTIQSQGGQTAREWITLWSLTSRSPETNLWKQSSPSRSTLEPPIILHPHTPKGNRTNSHSCRCISCRLRPWPSSSISSKTVAFTSIALKLSSQLIPSVPDLSCDPGCLGRATSMRSISVPFHMICARRWR